MKIKPMVEKKISLSNEGHLSLFFLGSGSAFSKLHNQNNLLVIKGHDHLLIDCGTKCPQALFSVGISAFDIQNYFITHSHADHIGGLEEVALMGRYVAQKKPNIYITEEYERILWEYSLKGGTAFNEGGVANQLQFSDFFDIYRPEKLNGFPRDTYQIQIGSINIKIMRTRHIPNIAKSWADAYWSTGVLLDDKVLFSGDTLFDKDLLYDFDKMFSLDAIFHDCQFFNGGVHASLEDLSSLPEIMRKKIFLMHYGDNWPQFESEIKEKKFAGLVEQMVFYDFE